jgi:hypothetical protein
MTATAEAMATKLLKELGVKPPEGGWASLDEKAPEAEAARKEHALRRYERAQVVAAPFMTPGGQACLAELRAATIESPAWQPDQLGLLNAIGSGILREGQNSLVRWIQQQIEIVQQGPDGTAKPGPKRKSR